jgi:hypothetical protein
VVWERNPTGTKRKLVRKVWDPDGLEIEVFGSWWSNIAGLKLGHDLDEIAAGKLREDEVGQLRSTLQNIVMVLRDPEDTFPLPGRTIAEIIVALDLVPRPKGNPRSLGRLGQQLEGQRAKRR